MKDEKEQLEALQDIRKMMKDSSKFLSLSGLSGVFAGVYALIGAYLGQTLISQYILVDGSRVTFNRMQYPDILIKMIIICMAVLFFSIVTAFILSNGKAKKANQKLFDHTSKKVIWNMMIPLFAGGLFCISLLFHSLVVLVGPVMLLFYGMALINCSKYTMSDIKYLGYLEMALGVVASFFLGYGLFFWAIGFGVLHIIYGTIMWFKYDRIN